MTNCSLCTLLFFLLNAVNGFQPSGKPLIHDIANQNLGNDKTIEVHPIATQKDVLDLADLRFDEWMLNDSDSSSTPPSRYAFRMATAEVTDERGQEGAVSFLATMGPSTIVVGSAELSPIELRGTMDASTTANTPWLYVTDVVTSSNHRRLGVGNALMDAVEEHASQHMSCTRIYLHVCPDNEGAIRFYNKRGYSQVSNNAELDAKSLAQAAGTEGQFLLFADLALRGSQKMRKRGSKSKGFG